MPYKDIEKRREKSRNYNNRIKREDPERFKAWQRKARQKARSDARYTMLNSARERARLFDLPLNITVEDIIIPEFCPVLGIPIIRGESRPTDNSPSLDRIIPSLGYVKGNIAVISYRANRIKTDASLSELLAVAAYIASTIE